MVVLCAGCTKDKTVVFSADETAQIIGRIRTDSMLSEKDYENMLLQLEGMLEIVCDKAECVIDSGYHPDDVRGRLGMDSVYRRIVEQGAVMDSALVNYLNSPYSNPSLRKRYRVILSRYTGRATKAGL